MVSETTARPAEGVRPGILGWTFVRLIILGAAVALVAVAATILARLILPPAPSPWHALVQVKNVVLPIAELLVYAALVRWLEHRPAHEIDLRQGAGFFAIGLAFGAAVIAAVILILGVAGFVTINSGTGAEGLAGEMLVPFTTAVVEEILFRAILFRLAEEIVGTTLAVLLSAALFAASHLGNPGATAVTTLFLALDLGVLLAVAFAAARSLWLPIGLHMGWNIALGYMFGTLNSGVSDPNALLRTTFTAPPWLSGGEFGLEGSIITLVVSALLSGALIRHARHHGSWRSRPALHAA